MKFLSPFISAMPSFDFDKLLMVLSPPEIIAISFGFLLNSSIKCFIPEPLMIAARPVGLSDHLGIRINESFEQFT